MSAFQPRPYIGNAVLLYMSFRRSYTSIGRLSSDYERVLSMTDGQLMLTYRGGDDCGGGRMSETIVSLYCDKHSLVIYSCFDCHVL